MVSVGLSGTILAFTAETIHMKVLTLFDLAIFWSHSLCSRHVLEWILKY